MLLRPSSLGFSLVELSIVLVILGLLVGGILGGKSLIHAAELRSVSTQQQQYYAAVKSFRDKYFGLPGDITNATQFWGQAALPGWCNLATPAPPLTCNGNGDGYVDNWYSSYNHEPFRFWQQLANAGLIAGQYSGSGNMYPTIYQTDPANSPTGKVGQGVWMPWHIDTITTGVVTANAVFNGDYGQALAYGTAGTNGAVMTPEDAWNIDTKMDDGKPATGKVAASAWSFGTYLSVCTDATGTLAAQTANLAANYQLSVATLACSLVFKNQL